MGQSYHALWVHLIWSTRYRRPQITPEVKYKLYDIIRQIAKEKDYYLDFINGVEDHVHLLMCLKPKFAVADVVKNLKGLSHARARDAGLMDPILHYQDGYAAFSVSPRSVPFVRNYIRNQEKHHQKLTFETEWHSLHKQALILPDPPEIYTGPPLIWE